MSEVIDLVNPDERSGETPALCQTPTATDIVQVIDLARQLRSLGSIVGAPGTGKTSALLWYKENRPGVHYALMNPAQSTMTGMLTLVCQSLGIMCPPCCRDMHDAIRRWAEWSLAPERVLLIDEAQHLNDQCLDELRCIYDQTGLPLVFSGNESLRDRFNGARAAAFAQLTSRIVPRLDLKAPTAADVRVLARHAGAHEPKALAYLEKWIGGTAGLRQVASFLSLGRKVAGSGDIRLSHLKQAVAAITGAAR